MIRVWSSPENLERRRRADTLATARGVDLMHVALAYVFSQAFPVFPLIGPRNYAELRGCWQALSLDLDQAEVMYHKSLTINEALGRQEGMASQYGNLGILYQTRGDLDQAETMYLKAISLFEEVGAKLQVAHVKQLLEAIQQQRTTVSKEGE